MTKLGHVLRPQILVNDTPDFSGVRALDKGISPPLKGILHIYKSSWVALTIPPGKRLPSLLSKERAEFCQINQLSSVHQGSHIR